MSVDSQLIKTVLIETLRELNIATKEDVLASERRLKLRIGKTRNDLAEKIANLATASPTLRDFKKLEQKVESIYAS